MAVRAEADERNGTRWDPRAKGDAELDRMPDVATPCELSRTTLKPGPLVQTELPQRPLELTGAVMNGTW